MLFTCLKFNENILPFQGNSFMTPREEGNTITEGNNGQTALLLGGEN